MDMETRKLGKTDLEVTRLAFGGARISVEDVSETQVGRLLNALLDTGANFLDTSACYQDSEKMIGATVSNRRDQFVLATKCGHASGLDGDDWTAPVIKASVDRSLARLKTDVIDLLQLHSCSAEVLRKGEVVEAIVRARDEGKVRYIGYSGDNENALEAIRMGVFATLQTSFNVVDQKARREVLPAAVEAGMGIICKRPVANGALGKVKSPYEYADTYWERARKMQIPKGAPEDSFELSLRFTLSHDPIDTVIVGTSQLENALAGGIIHGGNDRLLYPDRPRELVPIYFDRDPDTGAFSNGLVAVTYELEDTVCNGGGFGCLAGSHKSPTPVPEAWLDLSKGVHPMITRIPAPAGAAIIFTEALQHVTLPWTAPSTRTTLFYKYTKADETWVGEDKFFSPDDLEGWEGVDERKRAIMRPPPDSFMERRAELARQQEKGGA